MHSASASTRAATTGPSSSGTSERMISEFRPDFRPKVRDHHRPIPPAYRSRVGFVTARVPCAGAVVLDSAGRLLLVRRAREPGRGRWSLPGGRVEAGETAAAAAVREVREE